MRLDVFKFGVKLDCKGPVRSALNSCIYLTKATIFNCPLGSISELRTTALFLNGWF